MNGKLNNFLQSIKEYNYIDWDNALKSNELTRDIYPYLENVPQALKWHPEFDLTKHVFLVFTAIKRMGFDQLLETALFHDIGKKETTNVGKDRIYSYDHAIRSCFLLEKFKDRMDYYDITYDTTKRHMDYMAANEPPIKNDLLMKTFVTADKVLSKTLYYEFFFEQDDENNKLKEKKLFDDQQNSNKTVYITVGISGSGKSSYLKNEFHRSNFLVSSDALRKELYKNINDQSNNEKLWNEDIPNEMLDALRQGDSVILDATNLNKSQRIKFMSKFNGCKKVALVFDVDVEEAIKRVKNDINNNVIRSNVPENVIRKQYKSFINGLSSLDHEFNEVIIVS